MSKKKNHGLRPPTSIRMEEDLRKEIEKLALSENRSISNTIHILLRRELSRRARKSREQEASLMNGDGHAGVLS